MIRILQSVNVMDRAGLETMLMNYYRNIDRTQVQFDFLTHRPDIGAYEDEIKELGGHVFHAPRLYPQNYIAYYKWMNKFFSEHPEYKIIHSHIDAMSAFPLFMAKRNRIPVRIAHSHSSKFDIDKKLPIKYVAQKSIPKLTTDNFACGDVAGKFMFPNKNFSVIHNAIDLQKFAFNAEIRQRVRVSLGIKDELVIGHVGRFCYIKNQLFLLDIFENVLRTNANAALVLVGKGEDEDKIRAKAKDLGIDQKVKILVDRSDVNELYQAFDIFVMPSLFEGLPVVGVEAQASGLPCLLSDKISKEILMTSSIKMISLESSAQQWADEILLLSGKRNNNATRELQDSGYDIVSEAKKLEQWYLAHYKG